MMGVIFDFNGTLFFDGEQQERAWRLFAREAFGKEISDGEFRECVHGRNNDFTMQHLAGKALSARQVDEYVEEKETIYRRLCREDAARFHLALGAEELLDELRERGIPRTIATASRRGNVDFYIESFRLERWFDVEKLVYDGITFYFIDNEQYFGRNYIYGYGADEGEHRLRGRGLGDSRGSGGGRGEGDRGRPGGAAGGV